jgi:AbrB family looped-hinge helix DNA binding protein
MTISNATRKTVKPLAKGQITIPIEFRRALGIDSETLLNVSLVDDHLEITPVVDQAQLRRYTDEEITRFLEEDKLEPSVADKVRDLLSRGAL